jgi:hypothetical protein
LDASDADKRHQSWTGGEMDAYTSVSRLRNAKKAAAGTLLPLCLGSLFRHGELTAQQPSGHASSEVNQGQAATSTAPFSSPPARQPGSGFREPDPLDFNEHTGFTQIFDGATLRDWDGDPNTWRVESGAIVGESTKEKPVGNSYICYYGIIAKDFDLKLEIKVENGGGSAFSTAARRVCPGSVPEQATRPST